MAQSGNGPLASAFCAFWETGQVVKIEQGPGDKCNQYPGGKRVKGAHVAMQVGSNSSTGCSGSMEVTIL